MRRKTDHITALVVLAFACAIITAVPIFAMLGQAVPAPRFVSVDDVQDEKIKHIEEELHSQAAAITNLDSKMTYALGGIAGIYALIGIVGKLNFRILAGSSQPTRQNTNVDPSV